MCRARIIFEKRGLFPMRGVYYAIDRASWRSFIVPRANIIVRAKVNNNGRLSCRVCVFFSGVSFVFFFCGLMGEMFLQDVVRRDIIATLCENIRTAWFSARHRVNGRIQRWTVRFLWVFRVFEEQEERYRHRKNDFLLIRDNRLA